MQNNSGDQPVSIGECAILCRRMLEAIDKASEALQSRDDSRLKVAAAHLQMVVDLLDEA